MKAIDPPITQELLRERYLYDAENGGFVRRSVTHGHFVGSRVGAKRKDGYIYTVFLEHRCAVHRLVWMYFHGEWPKSQLDHINRDRADNRIENLREASQSLNNVNRAIDSKNNATGFYGVNEHRGKYQSRLRWNGKRHYLGTFSTPEEAHAAYMEAKLAIHPS